MKKLLLLLTIINCQLLIVNCSAQTSNFCIDSAFINITPSCPSNFDPVCACNGKTYRNECFSRSDGVITGQYSLGPCEPLYFFFYPSLALDFISINVSVKVASLVNIYIYDVYGNIKFFKDYLIDFPPYIYPIDNFDVTTLDKGVYVLVAETQGYYQLEKFVKINHGDN